MHARSVTTTFKPLSRRRYRCIQTGDIVKQARLESYRRQRWHTENPGRVIPRDPKPIVARVHTLWFAPYDPYVDCPKCYREHVAHHNKTSRCTCGAHLEFKRAY